MGLSFLLGCIGRGEDGLGAANVRPCFSPSSISFPSRKRFFSSSAIVVVMDVLMPNAKEGTGSKH